MTLLNESIDAITENVSDLYDSFFTEDGDLASPPYCNEHILNNLLELRNKVDDLINQIELNND